MQNGNGATHENFLLAVLCRTWPLVHPLQESYSRYGFLVTHSLMKVLWEKLSMFNVKVVVSDFVQEYPQQGNQFIV
jgi:hypothetical protein